MFTIFDQVWKYIMDLSSLWVAKLKIKFMRSSLYQSQMRWLTTCTLEISCHHSSRHCHKDVKSRMKISSEFMEPSYLPLAKVTAPLILCAPQVCWGIVTGCSNAVMEISTLNSQPLVAWNFHYLILINFRFSYLCMIMQNVLPH